MKHQSILKLTLSALFVALITIGAYLKIPIPYVPITLQYAFVVLSGLLFGPKFGGWVVGTYVFLGLAGLPLFTKGGGPMYVLQPTFGYLVGFIFASIWAGYWLRRRQSSRFKDKKNRILKDAEVMEVSDHGRRQRPHYMRFLCASVMGLIPVYLLGVTYLAAISGLYLNQAMPIFKLLWHGLLIFLPSDILVSTLAATVAYRLYPMVQNFYSHKLSPDTSSK